MLPYINTPFIWLSGLLGASVDEIKLISLFLLSYPFAGILKRIPDGKPYQKNLFIISISVFYLVGLFDLWDGLWGLLFSSAGAYIIASNIEGPIMPWIGFVFLMGHMSVSHIHRQQRGDDSVVDVTGAQMVLVMKLTAFCWNVHDGRLSEKDLTDAQKERAIKKLPDLLDYAGYVLFFPGLMAGPAFDYVDYTRYISCSMFEVPPGVDPAKAPPTRKKRKIPRSGRPALRKALAGIIWIVTFLQLSGIYSSDLLVSDKYLQYSFLRRVWIMHVVGFVHRTKYYGVWFLTEGSCILSGIGYNGFDPKTGVAKWDRLVNVKPIDLEMAQNTRAYLGNWNLNTNAWLRNYMYLRVTPKGKKPGFRASLATFVTSAVWHGFYPGYYMAFVLASFLQTIAIKGRNLVRPFFLDPADQKPLPSKIYYDVFTWIITQCTFTFAALAFALLHWDKIMKVWGSVYYYVVFGALFCMVLLASPLKLMLANKVKARQQRPAQPTRTYSPDTNEVMFGVPQDAEEGLREAIEEIQRDIEAAKRDGLHVPDVDEMRALLMQKLQGKGIQMKETAGKKEL